MLPYVVYTFHSSLQKCQTQIVCAVHVVRHATLEMIQKQMKHYFEEKHNRVRWSLQHFNNKMYVGAPNTNNPMSNAVTECTLTLTGSACRSVSS